MKRLLTGLGAALCLVLLSAPATQAAYPAQGNFGLHSFDVTFTDQSGAPDLAAGAHPFAYTTQLALNTDTGEGLPEGWLRDLLLTQAPGLAADTTAYPRCSNADFLAIDGNTGVNSCPIDTAVGISASAVNDPGQWTSAPVFNLVPPPGVLIRLGFHAVVPNVILDITLATEPPYLPVVVSRNTPQLADIYANKTQIWGVPTDPAHDALRGPCALDVVSGLGPDPDAFNFEGSGESCPVPANPRPFLTTPTNCTAPLATSYEVFSWEGNVFNEGALIDDGFDAGSVLTHGAGGPLPFHGCDGLAPFAPRIDARPTSRAATSPTGLDFELSLDDEGLTSTKAGARATSQIRSVRVTLPAGMSVNPSQAEGLAVCSEADLAAETLDAAPGQGCPQASKIGTVEVTSPLIAEAVKGALYVAEPYRNLAGDSLLAVYLVFKSQKLGIDIKQPLRVEPDPATGQLTTYAEEIPQLPFSSFRLHFREGTRSPLVTPPACGTHTASALITPYSGGAPATASSSFEIVSGPDSSPCPTGGLPPFKPGLTAGTVNNAAGHFSPFNLRLSRSDSEQEITHFSIKLPPGVVGKLAGVSTCPDAAIAAATARTGPLGGHEELASPSCPASSYVGRTLVGSGVGPSLAYAPGNVYLAGPYHGAPISIVAITAGVVGPFDIGTVVVREALRIDPETAEVFIDATGSDPIPHIIKGIPVHLRDIRVYTDRPEFVLNPTGCEPTSTASTVLGSGLDFISAADDNPVVVSTRFQAADCAALPFKPKLSFKLKGSTKRGGNPSLRAHVAMNGIGEAAIRFAQVSLPRSEFLDNAHIGTICTRVQFREGTVPGEKCPAASVYGHVSAVTPILDGPLTGPIYLRSSEHELPDLVAALHHEEINVALVGRVDSVKGGGIRNTFEFVPDAPVTSADFVFDGASKGLLQNSTNLCKGTHKAKVLLKAHSGKRVQYKTPLKPTGCKGHKKGKRGHRRGRAAP